MKKTIIATVTAAFLLATGPAFAGKDIPYDQLPPAVQKSIEQLTPRASVQEVELEKKMDAAVYYEVEYLREGVKWEIHIAEDGRVLKHVKD